MPVPSTKNKPRTFLNTSIGTLKVGVGTNPKTHFKFKFTFVFTKILFLSLRESILS